ncbi:MAG: OmpA family protein [Deltaproteobacteria bacterium]|nr:OmpA family protein [Deltaproteobacteria bacterium]
MTKYYLKAVFLVMISTLLFSCAAQQVQTAQPLFSPDTLEADQYEPKVDNFMVILDKSSSMSYKYNGQKRLTIAKDFLSAMNQTLPEMKFNCALRTFGTSGFGKPTALFYGPTEYSRKGFQGALDAAQRAIGTSPLGAAINAAAGDLKKSEGQIAVIIVSDGEEMDATPITAAKNMKAKFGDRVKPVAKPMDSDGDGVTDDKDQCPNTPKGATVDARGCWTYAAVVMYDFDSAEIKSEAYPMLDEAVLILGKNPELKVEIDGHTDNVGPAAYNMNLSERRAKAVMQYFVDKGVEAQRLTTKGFGSTNPAASNDTKEGRAKNRRVELTPVK